eukprot:4920534-Amphidinium_carterae.1
MSVTSIAAHHACTGAHIASQASSQTHDSKMLTPTSTCSQSPKPLVQKASHCPTRAGSSAMARLKLLNAC